MLTNDLPRYEILDEAAMAELERGWRRIVSELGIEFLLPEAVEILRAAGQTVEGENRVRFDPDFILEQVAKAPREFDLAARNLVAALHAAGGQPDDLVSLQIYVTDLPEYRTSLRELGSVWRTHFGRRYPAMAVLGVTGLFDPSALVELAGVAVIP